MAQNKSSQSDCFSEIGYYDALRSLGGPSGLKDDPNTTTTKKLSSQFNISYKYINKKNPVTEESFSGSLIERSNRLMKKKEYQ